jgi:hypothetical protein
MTNAASMVGRTESGRPALVYERFIQELGIPVHRGLGMRDVREVALGPCPSLGGKAASLELDGIGG